VAVARALPEDERGDAYAEVLEAARDALAAEPTAGVVGRPGVRVVERLASELPDSRLDEVLALVRGAELRGYELDQALGAVLRRLAKADPASAARHAQELATTPRDDVLAEAALSHARAGRTAEALALIGRIKVDMVRAPALAQLAPAIEDVEDPDLLRELRRLPAHHQIDVLRELAEAARGPAPALRRVAEDLPEPDRTRALAACAPAVAPPEVQATRSALLDMDVNPDRELAEIAPYLTEAQTRTALDSMTDPELTGWDALTTLAIRLAELGAADEALARVASAPDPHQLHRPDVLAALAEHLPPSLLPAVRAAIQPSATTEERVAARIALVRHLPSDRVDEVIADAAALDHPVARARATAALLAAGHRAAESALASALREGFESQHLDRYRVALEVVRTVAKSGAPVSPGLVAAVQAMPSPPDVLLALLALAQGVDGTGTRATASAGADMLLSDRSLRGVVHTATVARAVPRVGVTPPCAGDSDSRGPQGVRLAGQRPSAAASGL
jgi:hypothetical protein